MAQPSSSCAFTRLTWAKLLADRGQQLTPFGHFFWWAARSKGSVARWKWLMKKVAAANLEKAVVKENLPAKAEENARNGPIPLGEDALLFGVVAAAAAGGHAVVLEADAEAHRADDTKDLFLPGVAAAHL